MNSLKNLPNFLYIGPDKAGSTWIHRVLSWHPMIFMTPVKDIYFFDRYYARGFKWYLKHFSGVKDELVIGEVSHDYLYSLEACERIAENLPDVKLMVCLREPIERAFSSYLHLLKHGAIKCNFEEAIEKEPSLIEHGMYAEYLHRYIEIFGKKRICVAVFDELRQDPNGFAKGLFGYLGVNSHDLPEELLSRTLPAARPRSALLANFVKHMAVTTRELGLTWIVGRVKAMNWLQYLLYVPYTETERPIPNPDMVGSLKELYKKDIRNLDSLLNTDFQTLWKY